MATDPLLDAAEAGDVHAQIQLGFRYLDGDEVLPKDVPRALDWLARAAHGGDDEASYILGSLYFFGEDVPKDLQKAFSWYRKSAALGNAKAQFSLGYALFSGEGLKQDLGEAYRWLEPAAQQGHPGALFIVGVALRDGIGCDKNLEGARACFAAGAELGDETNRQALEAMG